MSYTALYRKFRPQTFDEVKGQEHIVTTLKNQIKANRIGHAYLFTGTRGTGKTSNAKIFAKAVNCEHPVDGNPCNTCDMCKAISVGTSMNVVEIDAASNNSVNNIRDIIEEVTYAPTEGKYKVYIIDEVHMLSAGAFNALLKTLEEPPEYVIFILATTEVHKIPITILSRCQRYDFKRISIDTIADQLTDLMKKENILAEEKAIRYIAKTADGSMRDALSLLDQCIAFYLGETIEYDNVLKVLGAVDTEVFSRLLRGLIQRQVIQALDILDTVIVQGRELGQFIIDFTWYLRNLLLLKSSENMEDVLDISSDNLLLLKEEADMISSEELIRYIQILSELSNRLRYATQKRVLIEIAFIKLCKPQTQKDYEAILSRLEQIENQLEQGIPVAIPDVTSDMTGKEPPKIQKEPLPDALPAEVRELAENWGNILSNAPSGLMLETVKHAQPTADKDGRFLLIYDLPQELVMFKQASSPKGKQEIETMIEQAIGKHVEVFVKANDTGISKEKAFTNLLTELAQNKDIEVVTEDF